MRAALPWDMNGLACGKGPTFRAQMQHCVQQLTESSSRTHVMVPPMRVGSTRRETKQTIPPAVLALVVFGILALTFIVLLPAQAGARKLDGAGTASLDNSPVRPIVATPQTAGKAAGASRARKRSGAGASVTRSGGGLRIPGYPVIRNVRCLRQCVSRARATRRSIIALRGDNLNRVSRVIFRVRKGWIRTRWRTRRRGAIRVDVPKRAVKGFLAVVDFQGNRARSPRRLRISPVSAIPEEVFPVRGPIGFGSSGSRFGAGRSGHRHQGQDISAACGTKLVAVRKSRVLYNRWDSGAGNYVVLHNLGTNTNFVYMHMRRRSRLRAGQVIRAGAAVGRVGNTGRSFGCHLHFEYWVGPWQTGGRPIDPLNYLRSLLK